MVAANNQQQIKRERRQISHYELITYASSVILLIVSLFFYLWPKMQIVNLSYRWEKLQLNKQEVLKQNQIYVLEIATLRSMQRIEKIAKENLGMIEPEGGQTVVVELEQGKKQ